jgi:hypothetical protein
MRILGFKDQYLRASQGAGTWPLVGCQSPVPEVTRKRLLGQTPSDPNGAAWRTIPCSRRAIGRGSMRARTPSTPEFDQLALPRSEGLVRRLLAPQPGHRQCGRRSIAGSGDKRCRQPTFCAPRLSCMGRHHANRGRRYKQLLRGHVVVSAGAGLETTSFQIVRTSPCQNVTPETHLFQDGFRQVLRMVAGAGLGLPGLLPPT